MDKKIVTICIVGMFLLISFTVIPVLGMKKTYETENRLTIKSCSINQAPSPPLIKGPASGKIGKWYAWIFCSTDPDGDNIKYCVTWGDLCGDALCSTVTKFYPSGKNVTLYHRYEECSDNDPYIIGAKAMDVYGAFSEWVLFEVTMPKSRTLHNLLSNILKQVQCDFSLLKNLIGTKNYTAKMFII